MYSDPIHLLLIPLTPPRLAHYPHNFTPSSLFYNLLCPVCAPTKGHALREMDYTLQKPSTINCPSATALPHPCQNVAWLGLRQAERLLCGS